MQRFPARVIWGGFIATFVVTVLIYIAPLIGMPKMDFAALLGSVFTEGTPQLWSLPWWTGMIIHFCDGAIIFSLIYAYVFLSYLPGPPWLRGIQWGVILWLLSQAIVMPVMGIGFFSANMSQPVLWVLGSLLSHIVYGGILGAIVGEYAVPLPVTEHDMIEGRERRHGMRI